MGKYILIIGRNSCRSKLGSLKLKGRIGYSSIKYPPSWAKIPRKLLTLLIKTKPIKVSMGNIGGDNCRIFK